MNIVLITGSSRGIGSELAIKFAQKGYDVAINYVREKAKADDLVEKIRSFGRRCEAFQADVSNFGEAKKLVDSVIKKFGALDVVVNNASITINKSIFKLSEDDWNKVISTDLSSVFYVSKEAARLMTRLGGSIINIGSITGVKGSAGSANYSSAKAGIIALTKSMALELGRYKVRVNAVLPGFHLTDMGKASSSEYKTKANEDSVLKTTTDINEVTDFVVFVSGLKTISGQVFNIDSRII
jgi:3-oxoacyl-[acyl-carrier protein] reductase